MKHYFQEHQGAGRELPKAERSEIETAIGSCACQVAKSKGGKIREEITDHLARNGWPGEIPVAPPSKISISSMKNGVGLCIQTAGNMSRMYADLLKLQTLYQAEKIRVGVIVLPTAKAAKLLGDNLANADRLFRELSIYRKVIHMPLAVISFE